jgi:hypothetical protein
LLYTLDTEFYEHDHTVEPISIALVCEDGRELEWENTAFDWGYITALAHHPSPRVSDTPKWLLENVAPNLGDGEGPSSIILPPYPFDEALYKFIGDDKKPSFWAYFADYDWVVFCQTIGRMIDLPRHFPKYCLDIKQLMRESGCDPKAGPVNGAEWPKQDQSSKHGALADARHNMEILRFMYHVDPMAHAAIERSSRPATQLAPRVVPF